MPSAAAFVLPFTDSNAQGYIGLCNARGQSITSGSTLTVPFAWKAISSAPVPQGYAKGKATLYAYQPRPQLDPGEWSGEQLTGSSTFSNPSHPLVQATEDDYPLVAFVGAFPPMEEGLVELRIYFTGIDLPQYASTYPATVLQVTGTTWKVVSGGTVPCSSGTGVSGETVALGAARTTKPETANTVPGRSGQTVPTTVPGLVGAGTGTSTTTSPKTSSSAPGSSSPSQSGGTGQEASGGAHPGSSGGSGGLSALEVALIALAAAAAAGAGGFGLARRLRR
jgi:hypothetical protein